MPMNAGSVSAQTGAPGSITVSGGVVTVDPHSWFSGSGLALEMAQQHFVGMVVNYGPAFVTLILTKDPATLTGIASFVATGASAYSSAIVSHLQANATAVVTTQSLGVMPASTSAGTPIGAPATPVEVPIQ